MSLSLDLQSSSLTGGFFDDSDLFGADGEAAESSCRGRGRGRASQAKAAAKAAAKGKAAPRPPKNAPYAK
eukprot:11626249-Alexandrium_andersonii.AAC.1